MHVLNTASPVLRTVLLACAVCNFACGGGDDGASDNRGPRLEWDQQAESLAQAQSMSFRLYVDDVGRPLNGECRTSGGGGYVCSAALPQFGAGRHVLQLATVLTGVESPRSEPLVVSGDAGQQLTFAEFESVISEVPSTACLTSTATECWTVREVATGLLGIRALSPAPDGRLFFVEDNTRVRVVADGALLPESALAVNGDQARIVSLTVDAWSFPEKRLVFVAWTDQTKSGQQQLNVTRYREVANTLGEGATILTGVPVPPDIPPSIAVDRNGYVYVAVPAPDTESSPPGSGAVLRITREGGVPADNRLGLATFASGFSSPTSIFVDSSQRNVWLGGRNSSSSSELGVVPTSRSDQPQVIRVVTQVASDQPVSFLFAKAEESPQPALFALADERLSKALKAQDGSVTSYALLDLGQLQLKAAAATETGSIFVATDTSIFELFRR